MKIKYSVLILMLTFYSCLGQDNSNIKKDEIKKFSVFNAGDDDIDSYRIPSIVCSKEGTLLAFIEARKESSTDKSPTDIAVKRSTDNGYSWSEVLLLTDGGDDAFMDPVALVDEITGRIFLFTTKWPSEDHSILGNSAWMVYSDDDGINWSKPINITKEIVADNHFIGGFGPGSGIQMKGRKFKNRLIVPTRQTDGNNYKNRIIYSDDNGETWEIGNSAPDGGEYDIVEAADDVLLYNLRAGKGKRVVSKSFDGGLNWEKSFIDFDLQSSVDYGGCQGSMFRVNGTVFYVGPAGGLGGELEEDRQNLFIYRSFDGGETWENKFLLYEKSSGYSSITQNNNGELVIIFESGDSDGFPKLLPDIRPPGWMRIDVLILPESIIRKDRWFK